MPAALSLTAVGSHAVLAQVRDTAEALSLAAWARVARVDAEEIVPGARTVLFDGLRDPEGLGSRIGAWTPSAPAPAGPLIEVPMTYDGADLEFVAERWGTDADGVAARLGQAELVSAFCGFSPGFAYLSGLPAELAVPRLESPRSAVPAGSVALGDTWCGIYPTASPGGWRLVGRTELVLWDAGLDEPALLAPGTRVRLVPS